MINKTIGDSEKLVVYFGGVCFKKGVLDELDDYDFEELDVFNIKYKKEIIAKLNDRGGVSNIQDLFDKNPYVPNMKPFMFQLRIPFALQNPLYRELHFGLIEKATKTEDFIIIFDGFLLLVATICNINETTHGVYDARDVFFEILNTVYDVEKIPPCLTHSSIAFVNEGLKKGKEGRSLYINIIKDFEIENLLRSFYSYISHGLWNFYNCCSVISGINENIIEINEIEKNLIDNLKEYFTLKWYQYNKKTDLIKNIKKSILNLITKTSGHTMMIQEYNKLKNSIVSRMENDEMYSDFMSLAFVGDKALSNLNVESTMNLIQNIRSEIETYEINFSSIISAFIGVIFGSLFTFIFTYLMSVTQNS